MLGQRTPLPQVPSSSASEQEPTLFARPQVTFSGDDKTVQNKSNSASSSKLQSTGQHFAPKAFIQESEFGYVLHAVLPGIKAKDIVAELLPNRRLLISGVRFSFSEGEGQGMKDNSGMKIYHKISSDPFILSMKEEPILPYGRFKISWKLPKDADLESLRAKVEVRLFPFLFFSFSKI